MRFIKKAWIRILVSALILSVALVVSSPQVSVESGGFLGLSTHVNISIGQPAQASATITSLGTDARKGVNNVHVDNCNISAGDWMIAVFAGDTQAGSVYADTGATYDYLVKDSEAVNSGNVEVSIWSGQATVGNANASIYCGASVGSLSMTAYKVTGLAASPLDKNPSTTGSVNGGSITTTTTGTLSQADEVCIAAIGLEEETDQFGTWTTGASYIDGNTQTDGTTGAGGASNISVSSQAEIVSATTALEGEQTSCGKADYGACAATYKIQAGADISNSPATWTLNGITGNSTIQPDTVYYSNPNGDTTTPNSTVADGDCRFTLTNNSSIAIDLTVNCSDFSGGSANMTNSDTGSNGATSYGAYSWYSGMTYSNKVVMKTTGSDFLYSNLPISTNLKWGAEIETQTNSFSGGTPSAATMTITATAH